MCIKFEEKFKALMGKPKHSVEYSINNGVTSPYIYLGEAEYVRHEENKPISFACRLKEDILAGLIRSAEKGAV